MHYRMQRCRMALAQAQRLDDCLIAQRNTQESADWKGIDLGLGCSDCLDCNFALSLPLSLCFFSSLEGERWTPDLAEAGFTRLQTGAPELGCQSTAEQACSLFHGFRRKRLPVHAGGCWHRCGPGHCLGGPRDDRRARGGGSGGLALGVDPFGELLPLRRGFAGSPSAKLPEALRRRLDTRSNTRASGGLWRASVCAHGPAKRRQEAPLL